MIKNNLKKHNGISNKISSLFKEEFDSEPVYIDKYMKTNVNLYSTNFLVKRVSKMNVTYGLLS